jgi:hypothetical protein
MDVIAEAQGQGFTLEERVVNAEWVHGWSRDDDDRWPYFHERRLALSWMEDRLRRIGVFDR